MWASPGKYLGSSTLRKLAHRGGHLTADEAAIFIIEGVTKKGDEYVDNDEEMDDIHSGIVYESAMQSSLTPVHWKKSGNESGNLCDDNEDDEDEDDEDEDDENDEDDED
ncbi:hypothetical protein ACHAQJ_002607 [Trichoderma viride]